MSTDFAFKSFSILLCPDFFKWQGIYLMTLLYLSADYIFLDYNKNEIFGISRTGFDYTTSERFSYSGLSKM